MKTPEAREPASGKNYQVIGTRPVLQDAIDKVTGRAQYGADIRLPGMLFGAVLRSPHAHARILEIDTRQAEALPGVKAVVTAADLPTRAMAYVRHNVLATTKVLYYGHAVAAIAATDLHTAQEALKLIRVSYEQLPHILEMRQAMKPEAPILLDDLRTEELGKTGDRPSNISSHEQYQRGDLGQGFREAVHVVEREFATDMVHQGYLEPQNAVALFQEDGRLTIWCSTQGAFGVQEQVAEVLDMPVSRVRVIPMEVGGGFGGKNAVYLEPVAALLSRKSGHRPVKMAMRYSEVLAATGPTAGSYVRVKMGAAADGRLTAAEACLIYEAGAFPGSFSGSGASLIFAPYRIENVLVDAYDVVVNKPHVTTLRAPGATNAVFAGECVVDELCEKLGMDPLEFRLLNGVKEGDRRVDGPAYPDIGLLQTLRAARDHPHYTAPIEGAHHGRGVACGIWGNYGGTSSTSASVNPDGTVSLLTGSVDLSGTRTTTAMQLAETLGIPVEDVHAQVGDTGSVGFTEGSYGSRTTFATGWAAYELGQDLKRQLCIRAAQLLEVEPGEVTYQDRTFTAGGKSLALKELADRLGETGGPVTASAVARPDRAGPACAVHIVDVEVDPETGKVQVLRYTALQDVGKAIHPAAVEGQIQGGVAHGIGWGLYEGYAYDPQGHLQNASLLDYRLPTCLDVPLIETVLVEVPFQGHPYGVRGVGEVPIVPPPAALANAIYRAVGVRMSVLPMSPEHILEALWAQDKP